MHLMIVYLGWGSTYLAIRLAVREGAGFPPFTLAFVRVTIAGILLLGWNLIFRNRVKITRNEAAVLAALGLLMWTGGNGLVTWAETKVHSGLAALVVAILPVWISLIDMVIDRRLPHWKLALSIVIGIGGVTVLSWPDISSSSHQLGPMIGLLLAPLTWAAGTVWYIRRTPSLNVTVISGWQHLFGAVGFLIVMLIRQEPMPNPTPTAWGALFYLIIVGSIIAFTSYMRILTLLPTQITLTYAYVNPVVAVILGYIVLSEPITAWTISGAVLVLLGVAGVFNNREQITSGTVSKNE
ncbi:EamA family transporter [bacterium]|nr:EamA family transporter [bacterium]MBT7311600.1 EamA family transporter [bacterium]